MFDPYQFYPSTPELAKACWGRFSSHLHGTVLEPSAGRGDLIPKSVRSSLLGTGYREDRLEIHAVEMDPTHHAALREAGFKVVGLDFLEMTEAMATGYDRIIMNPPFRSGVQHVLHAWQILRGGEIVAVLNAETVRNPFSAERKALQALIEAHGDVEFMQSVFSDADRSTDVEVAIVHLAKAKPSAEQVFGDLFARIRDEADLFKSGEYVMDEDGVFRGEIALQGISDGEIETLIAIVNIAIAESVAATRADYRSRHYKSMIGLSSEDMAAAGLSASVMDANKEGIRADARRDGMAMNGSWTDKQMVRDIAEAARSVNKAGWMALFQRAEVTKRLSSSTAKDLSAQMDLFSEMAFTSRNVSLFIESLIGSQKNIQDAMLTSVFFGLFSHNSANVTLYRAWKSNDRHRLGMRLKMNRLIIPGMASYGSIDYSSISFVTDIDKCMALLDCKLWEQMSEGSLQSLIDSIRFSKGSKDYVNGQRIKGAYFDIRYYSGTGTLHLFPNRADIIDRFNRVVGCLHNWLPPADEMASRDFWKAYKSDKCGDADKLSKAAASSRFANTYGLGRVLGGSDEHEEDHDLVTGVEAALVRAWAEEGVDISGSLASDHAERRDDDMVTHLRIGHGSP